MLVHKKSHDPLRRRQALYSGGKMRDSRQGLKEKRFRLDIRKFFLLMRTVKHRRIGEGCADRLCKLHLWRFPRSDWTQTRTTWSDLVADPALSRRLCWWPPKAVPAWTILQSCDSPHCLQAGYIIRMEHKLGFLAKNQPSSCVSRSAGTRVCAYTYIHRHTLDFNDTWCNHNFLKNIYWVPCSDLLHMYWKYIGFNLNRKTINAYKCLVILLCFDIFWGKKCDY